MVKVTVLHVAPTLIAFKHGVVMNCVSMLMTRKLAMRAELDSLNVKLDVTFVKSSFVIFKRTM